MRPRSGRALAATASDQTGGRQHRSIPAQRPRPNAPTPWLDRRCRPMPRRRRVRETRVLPSDDVRSPVLSRHEIEEVQLAAAARESARGRTFEHYGDQPVARIENQCMERTLRARAVSRWIFLERELEERMELD